jgi:hypothetical protein
MRKVRRLGPASSRLIGRLGADSSVIVNPTPGQGTKNTPAPRTAPRLLPLPLTPHQPRLPAPYPKSPAVVLGRYTRYQSDSHAGSEIITPPSRGSSRHGQHGADHV